MTDIVVPKGLWDTKKTPEGIVANWFYADGGDVPEGCDRRRADGREIHLRYRGARLRDACILLWRKTASCGLEP